MSCGTVRWRTSVRSNDFRFGNSCRPVQRPGFEGVRTAHAGAIAASAWRKTRKLRELFRAGTMCSPTGVAWRLGMAVRTIEQRAWLERRFYEHLGKRRRYVRWAICTCVYRGAEAAGDNYFSRMNGYSKLVAGEKVSLMVRGLVQRIRLRGPPALSLVPEPRAPPKGCSPTMAPVGLSLM